MTKKKLKKKKTLIVLVILAAAVVAYVLLQAKTPPLEQLPPEMLTQADVERAIRGQEVIVIATVQSRKITNTGTRSESAFYELAVEECLLGQTERAITAGRWTQKKRHFIEAGETYLLQLSPKQAPGGNAHLLIRFEPVSQTRTDVVKEWIGKRHSASARGENAAHSVGAASTPRP